MTYESVYQLRVFEGLRIHTHRALVLTLGRWQLQHWVGESVRVRLSEYESESEE